MKYLLTLALILGVFLISCEKDIIEPISFNNTTIDTMGVYDGPVAEFPIEDSDSNVRVIDTFLGWGCDTFSSSPTMSAIGIFWGGGQETTVGIFAWEINYLVMCEDGIQVNSNEFYLYKHSGIGELIDYEYKILEASSEFYIDTVSLVDVYGIPYSDDDNSVILFHSQTTRPLNVKITSITVQNNDVN